MKMRSAAGCVLISLLLVLGYGNLVAADAGSLANEIISSSGTRGGLCVHLGCGDGRLTAELSQGKRFMVHGLVLDAGSLDTVRQFIHSRGLYGQVSVDKCSMERLPYTDNLVNLLVVDRLADLLAKGVSLREIMRVICPNGVAYLGQTTESGQPPLSEEELKTWLRNSGIAKFEIVKRSGIWVRITKPSTGRGEWTHYRQGPDGNMVAKDTVISPMIRQLQWIDGPFCDRGGWGSTDFATAVSAKGRLFCVYDSAPVSAQGPQRWIIVARDAYNGLLLWERDIKRTVWFDPKTLDWEKWKKGTGRRFIKKQAVAAVGDSVYTIITQGGPLTALDAATGKVVRTYDDIKDPDEIVCSGDSIVARTQDALVCVHAVSGKVRWKKGKGRNLRIANGQVFFEGNGIVCVDLSTGNEKWRQEGAGLVFCRNDMLVTKRSRTISALSAEDGRHLWSVQHVGGFASRDVFFAAGLVWCDSGGKKERRSIVGYDPLTGREKKRFYFPKGFPGTHSGFGHRCYPVRITENYFLCNTQGTDFVDLQAPPEEGMKVYANLALRGDCEFGFLPANGMIYAPPDHCGCNYQPDGFLALALKTYIDPKKVTLKAAERIERGGGSVGSLTSSPRMDEWPCYRHDPERSGGTASEVEPPLTLLWKKELGQGITAPTAAYGMVFVGLNNAHQICALDAKTGRLRWNYIAGGGVDTPPTIYGGMCIFGCRDGWVYCLAAKDGKLIWRFRAAPEERLIGAYRRLESLWPVHGSVIVDGGTAFFSAGWSSDNGGIYVYALDAKDGRLIWQKTFPDYFGEMLSGKITWEKWKETSVYFKQKAWQRTCASLNDILVKGRNGITMKKMSFNLKTGDMGFNGSAFVAAEGFLVDEWGRSGWSRSGVGGHAFVFDKDKAYILGHVKGCDRYRMFKFYPGNKEYKIYCKSHGWRSPYKWTARIPLRPKAMVVTGKTLFIGGLPDVIGEKGDYWAVFDGRKGGELWAFSKEDGTTLSEQKLSCPPIWDGMAAAYGRLYVAAGDGSLLCFEGHK